MRLKFLSVIVPIMLLLSCSKDDGGKEFCATCTLTETATVTGYPSQITTSTFEQCSWTQETLDAYLSVNNRTTTSTTSGITVTNKMEAACINK